MSASVLFDAPGPRGRRLQLVVGTVLAVLALGLAAWLGYEFKAKGQFDGALWKPWVDPTTWSDYVIPGLLSTLKAAAVSMLGAAIFGLVFGVGRLSHSAPIRWISGAVVEFFRAMPVLILMIAAFNILLNYGFVPGQEAFWGVVIALVLYNGSVVAELVRSGVMNLPKGQREGGMSIGLTQGQVMRQILLPQALTAMLPAIMSQIVVVLKDTAIGYIITYGELLTAGKQIGARGANPLQAFLLIALVYIVINYTLTLVAQWLERRTRSRGHTAALPPEANPEDKRVVHDTTNTIQVEGTL